jgi:hypothetical protein
MRRRYRIRCAGYNNYSSDSFDNWNRNNCGNSHNLTSDHHNLTSDHHNLRNGRSIWPMD